MTTKPDSTPLAGQSAPGPREPRGQAAWLLALAGAGMLAGLAAIFTWVPTDCSRRINGACFEGTVQRLFYVHVPSAWIAYLAFAVVLVGSIAFLRTGGQRWDHLASASAEIGVVFTAITLITGAMWAKPLWGTYWRFEPRLTLTLVLFLIYLGYIVFKQMATDAERGSRIAAVIGISGFAVIPLVHFSVQWWRGQHPGPIVIDPAVGDNLPAEMLTTLLLMVAVFSLLYAAMLVMRVRLAHTAGRVEALEAAARPWET